MKEIKALTGIRGIAALWVVIYHLGQGEMSTQIAPLDNVILHGYLAVDLFFVLSGFVMALSYGGLVGDGWSLKNYGAFLVRRIARVYPLYAVITLVVAGSILIGASHALTHEELYGSLCYNLLMMQAWGFSLNINNPAWSISTEFAAYLLFPLLAYLALVQRLSISLLLAGVCGVGLFLLQFVVLPHEELRRGLLDIAQAYSVWPLLRCLFEFSLGLVAFRFSQSPFSSKVSIALAIFLPLILTIEKADFVFVALVPLLILCLAQGNNILSRCFGGAAVFLLGEISYSVYLLHGQFMRITWLLPKILTPYVGATTAVTFSYIMMFISLLLCSWLSYRFFERPCRRWIAGWVR